MVIIPNNIFQYELEINVARIILSIEKLIHQ